MNAYNVTRVCGAAFLMGLAAAAPVGPVNMMAVRRGLLGGVRHTLVCGAGAVLGDLMLFSLALWGGHFFVLDLSSGRLRHTMALAGLVILLPFGIYFLALTLRRTETAFQHARQRWGESSVSGRLFDEGARAFLLTVLNPFALVYWAGVTSSWIPSAYALLGPRNLGWGIAAAGAGMMSWFGVLMVFVSFIPQQLSAQFFRILNLALGVILIAIAALCVVALIHPPQRSGIGVYLFSRVEDATCSLSHGA